MEILGLGCCAGSRSYPFALESQAGPFGTKGKKSGTADHDFAATTVQMPAFRGFYTPIYLAVRWRGRYRRGYGIDRRFLFAGIACCAAGNGAVLG